MPVAWREGAHPYGPGLTGWARQGKHLHPSRNEMLHFPSPGLISLSCCSSQPFQLPLYNSNEQELAAGTQLCPPEELEHILRGRRSPHCAKSALAQRRCGESDVILAKVWREPGTRLGEELGRAKSFPSACRIYNTHHWHPQQVPCHGSGASPFPFPLQDGGDLIPAVPPQQLNEGGGGRRSRERGHPAQLLPAVRGPGCGMNAAAVWD